LLFREARYLLAEEADIRDTALYHSVLAAVAQGNSTRGGIAEIDAAVVEPGSGGDRPAVALLGEAKWGTVMGLPHLERLTRARELLAGRGMGTEECRLACFSAAGFSDALRAEAAERGDVLLLGLAELYG
jgi:hypothetical protein